jgi:hypothetical protein
LAPVALAHASGNPPEVSREPGRDVERTGSASLDAAQCELAWLPFVQRLDGCSCWLGRQPTQRLRLFTLPHPAYRSLNGPASV